MYDFGAPASKAPASVKGTKTARPAPRPALPATGLDDRRMLAIILVTVAAALALPLRRRSGSVRR